MRRGIAALGAFAAVTALAACSGNTTPAAEPNAYADPEAMQIAFRSGLDVTMVGLDVTLKTAVPMWVKEAVERVETPEAQLAALLSVEDAADEAPQRRNAAVFADQAAHGGDKDRDHDRLEHAGCAAAHIAEQLRRMCRAGGEHDHRTGGDAGQKDDKHVDARHAADEDQNIRDRPQQSIVRDLHRADVAVQREDEDQRQRGQRGGGDSQPHAIYATQAGSRICAASWSYICR